MKVCVNYNTDTNNLRSVMYRDWSNLYLKDNEPDLKFKKNQTLLAKTVYLLSYNDFFKQCFVLDETTVYNRNNFRQKWMFSSYWAKCDTALELYFHLNSIVFAQTYFQGHVAVRMIKFLYVRRTKLLSLVESLVMGTRSWSFFVTPKRLECMHYSMMLVEQCNHVVVKTLVPVSSLDETEKYVCLITWLDYFFGFT